MLKVKVNKLTSIKTQLPYSYYSLPYCKAGKIVDSAENLGEVLRGDRIENSSYTVMFGLFKSAFMSIYYSTVTDWIVRLLQFKMREAQMCNVVCRKKLDAKQAKDLKEKIKDEYRVNM